MHSWISLTMLSRSLAGGVARVLPGVHAGHVRVLAGNRLSGSRAAVVVAVPFAVIRPAITETTGPGGVRAAA